MDDFKQTAQNLANAFIDDFTNQIKSKDTELKHLEGAIQGINLYFSKLIESMQKAELEVNNKVVVENENPKNVQKIKKGRKASAK